MVWFPWVSDHEVYGEGAISALTIVYLIAFILTLIIELLFNYQMLKKEYSKSDILKASLIANMLSYFLGSFGMYAFSFS